MTTPDRRSRERDYIKADPHDPDLFLVMDLQEDYWRSHPVGSEARAEHQRRWREAYFQAVREGVIEP